jgi:RNA polymerase sigma-70 factor (ECF subfamily)
MASPAQDQRFREQVLPELDVLYRVALRLTSSPPEAEDLVQDTLVRAFRSFDRFDGRFPRAWLLTILRNTRSNDLRKRRPDLLDAEVAGQVPDGGRDGDRDATASRAIAGQLAPQVRDAVAALSAKHRAVLVLVDLDGLTYREAAEVLEVPEGTVMSRLHRARRRVRSQLEEAGFLEVGG